LPKFLPRTFVATFSTDIDDQVNVSRKIYVSKLRIIVAFAAVVSVTKGYHCRRQEQSDFTITNADQISHYCIAAFPPIARFVFTFLTIIEFSRSTFRLVIVIDFVWL